MPAGVCERSRWLKVIEGEGVVGHLPVLRYGEPAFVYQSQTSATPSDSFSGAFFFGEPGHRPAPAAQSPHRYCMTEVTVPQFKFSRSGHLW